MPSISAKELTDKRKNQHGDWIKQSQMAYNLKFTFNAYHRNGPDLPAHQQEAIEMILTKISRIACGDPNHADHWNDIAGYAYLGKGGHDGT